MKGTVSETNYMNDFLVWVYMPVYMISVNRGPQKERVPAGDNFTHVRLYLKARAENRENMLAFLYT